MFNKLFTVMGGKFKVSAQESDLAPFFLNNGSKVQYIPSEIRSSLVYLCLL